MIGPKQAFVSRLIAVAAIGTGIFGLCARPDKDAWMAVTLLVLGVFSLWFAWYRGASRLRRVADRRAKEIGGNGRRR